MQCWGDNDVGQLGDGLSSHFRLVDSYGMFHDYSPSPVLVSGLTGVVGIESGYEYTCAQLMGGGLRCWGTDYSGQLGDDASRTWRRTPTQIAW